MCKIVVCFGCTGRWVFFGGVFGCVRGGGYKECKMKMDTLLFPGHGILRVRFSGCLGRKKYIHMRIQRKKGVWLSIPLLHLKGHWPKQTRQKFIKKCTQQATPTARNVH